MSKREKDFEKAAMDYCEDYSHCIYYEAGADYGYKYAMDNVCRWLHDHITCNKPIIEYNEDGQPLAESFLAHAKARCEAADEVVERFKEDFGL